MTLIQIEITKVTLMIISATAVSFGSLLIFASSLVHTRSEHM
ncbi:hypothetical protein Cyagr_0279 [Cyanobium gracile PCC 6307]|uniref:Uncharacterized protein n=1 Tax=Cyanobium gracile (strain ATCC 27147 / PCC 6307) TaxID=292564 RepID=K9P3C7_CYAGP|nr:hypothetical protein Cyagr_0279 [Cyanobium gracile PCC 6307]